jgi:small GTP-binding protein
MSVEEEIKKIEEEISKTPYNKATQAHIGRLKAKVARLKEEKPSSKSSGKIIAVKKSGDATVLLVGHPSVGKSTLLNSLTSADSKVAEYDFTTLSVIPGMLEYKSAKIQVLDIPGMIAGASVGKGMGRFIFSFIRSADLVLIMLDKPEQLAIIQKELYNAGFRLNKKPPEIKIVKKMTGGLRINAAVKLTKIDGKTIKSVFDEYRIHNADVIIREDIDLERLIDGLSKNRAYIPSLVVFNKADLLSTADLEKAKRISDIVISAKAGSNTDQLKELIWKKLGFVRIYLKRIGKEPDMKTPMIMTGNIRVRDVCEKIHRDFVSQFKYARIWGPSAKFGGQSVGIDQKLVDTDIVELHMQ